MRNYRAYVPAFILLVGAGFVWNARAQRAVPLAAPLKNILADAPGYRIQDQKLSDEERRIAGMSDYVARVYWRDSTAAFTTFVSYYDRQTQGQTIHSPRNCLPGAGWEILSGGEERVTAGGKTYLLNRYVLKKGAATAVAYYWYQGRGRVVANEYRVKWNLLRDAAVAGHTEEALVRVVVPVVLSKGPHDEDAAARSLAQASALAADVAGRLEQEVDRVLPKG
jgi:EpsI family protein